MTIEVALILLSAYAVVSGLITQAIKKLISKENMSCNLIAMIVAIIVGVAGTIVYYLLFNIPITTIGVVYALLLGIASGVGSMVGYDKVKQAVQQIAEMKTRK